MVGGLATVGWRLDAARSLRAGQTQLPPAGFSLRSGIALAGARAMSFAVFLLLCTLVDGIGRDTTVPLARIVPRAAVPAWVCVILLGPRLCLAVSRDGFRGALTPGVVRETARSLDHMVLTAAGLT